MTPTVITLHGGPVRLRLVTATPCFICEVVRNITEKNLYCQLTEFLHSVNVFLALICKSYLTGSRYGNLHRRRNRVGRVGHGPPRILTVWATHVFGPHGYFQLVQRVESKVQPI